MDDVEKIKEMKTCFEKCVDVLEKIIELMDKLDKEEDEEKMKQIQNEIEEKTGVFVVQMLKISSFKYGEKMKIDVNGETEDLSAMLIGAERYALGRRTYIVQWTCEFIGNNLHLLTEKDKQVMIRDIENPISYGEECDKACWMQLLEKLRKENITNEKAKSRKSRKEKQR